MDWYYGNGIDEFVVPQCQDISDRLPSPDSWSKWGTTTSERIGSPDKCFLKDSNLKEQEPSFDGNSLYNEVELDTSHDKDDSNGSSICEGLLEGAFYWRSPSHDRPDYQLDDLEGVEQTNDIFLNSLLEDLPEMEAIDGSFEFSPESPQCGGLPSDNLDSRRMWTDVNKTVGKSKYPKRHAFSPLMGRDNQDVTAVQFNPCNSEQMDCAPIKALTAGLQTSLISGTCKCNHILKKHILDDFVDSTAFAIPILASGIGRIPENISLPKCN